mmetsp:Transcript_13534/g.27670  ORF Transcript_13534/g.27670 Transcript_13534/m.27670 type:complete len:91 (-) Transcript_13534:100-372(-)
MVTSPPQAGQVPYRGGTRDNKSKSDRFPNGESTGLSDPAARNVLPHRVRLAVAKEFLPAKTPTKQSELHSNFKPLRFIRLVNQSNYVGVF